VKHSWIQLRNLKNAQTLLILPCNAAACVGNYFHAETYSKKGWNTWREADICLLKQRKNGQVAFAAVDSSILETEPIGLKSKGAIVFETEMNRVRNPSGEDWGSPSWGWFRPTTAGNCEYLETLTESLVKAVRRVEKMGFTQVFVMVNPRGYFLSLVAAVDRCGLLNKWILFRVPAHRRHLLSVVREITPFVRASAEGRKIKGGIYPIPSMYPFMQKEDKASKDSLPKPWQNYSGLPSIKEAKAKWLLINKK
jgi:hypothetical protein